MEKEASKTSEQENNNSTTQYSEEQIITIKKDSDSEYFDFTNQNYYNVQITDKIKYIDFSEFNEQNEIENYVIFLGEIGDSIQIDILSYIQQTKNSIKLDFIYFFERDRLLPFSLAERQVLFNTINELEKTLIENRNRLDESQSVTIIFDNIDTKLVYNKDGKSGNNDLKEFMENKLREEDIQKRTQVIEFISNNDGNEHVYKIQVENSALIKFNKFEDLNETNEERKIIFEFEFNEQLDLNLKLDISNLKKITKEKPCKFFFDFKLKGIKNKNDSTLLSRSFCIIQDLIINLEDNYVYYLRVYTNDDNNDTENNYICSNDINSLVEYQQYMLHINALELNNIELVDNENGTNLDSYYIKLQEEKINRINFVKNKISNRGDICFYINYSELDRNYKIQIKDLLLQIKDSNVKSIYFVFKTPSETTEVNSLECIIKELQNKLYNALSSKQFIFTIVNTEDEFTDKDTEHDIYKSFAYTTNEPNNAEVTNENEKTIIDMENFFKSELKKHDEELKKEDNNSEIDEAKQHGKGPGTTTNTNTEPGSTTTKPGSTKVKPPMSPLEKLMIAMGALLIITCIVLIIRGLLLKKTKKK